MTAQLNVLWLICGSTMANLTQDENLAQLKNLPRCSAEVNASIHNQLICVSVLNIFLTITAFLGNTLILVALHKEISLHPPSKLLLQSLATTDLCVGIVVQPFLATSWISVVNEQWNICHVTLSAAMITGDTLCLASLLTLTAISVDRLLALLLGLRYRQVVTLKRTYILLVALWAVSILGSIIFIVNETILSLYIIVTTLLSVIISIYCYTRIFLRLRQHQTQVQGQPSQTIPLNILRYRKTVSSTRWLQLTLVACYLPFMVALVMTLEREKRGKKLSSSLVLAWAWAASLVFLNSSLNPILYCWKIREVRQAVKEAIRGLCPFR